MSLSKPSGNCDDFLALFFGDLISHCGTLSVEVERQIMLIVLGHRPWIWAPGTKIEPKIVRTILLFQAPTNARDVQKNSACRQNWNETIEKVRNLFVRHLAPPDGSCCEVVEQLHRPTIQGTTGASARAGHSMHFAIGTASPCHFEAASAEVLCISQATGIIDMHAKS
jgi:hypothetical protein